MPPPSLAPLQVGDGVFEVLSTSGDTHLGGDDFDKRIVDFMADEFQKNEGIDLRKDRQALQRLTEAAEKAKIELSALSQTSINLPFITATADGPKHIDTTVRRGMGQAGRGPGGRESVVSALEGGAAAASSRYLACPAPDAPSPYTHPPSAHPPPS